MPIRRRARARSRPISPGTARPRSTNAATSSPSRSASRRTRTIVIADVDLGRIRQERLRNGDVRRHAPLLEGDRVARFRRIELRARRRRPRASRSSGRSSAFPTCRPIRPSCATIATRPTTSRSRAWRSGCSRPASRTLVIGVSGGLDFDPCADRRLPSDWTCSACRARTSSPTRCRASPPSDKTNGNAWALMKALGVDGGRDRHQAGGAADAGRHRPSVRARARRSTTSPSRTCRRACAPTICSASPTSIAAWSSAPAICRSWGSAGAPTASAITCRHYNPNGSVSKTLIQHLIRFVAASGDVDDEHRQDPARHPRHRDLARAGSGRCNGAVQATESASVPTRCRTSTSTT